MGKTYVVIPDQHAHPEHDNNRADWVGELIKDIKPDVVVNMGDAADMASLSSYDKGKRSTLGRSYKNDIDSHLEFQERLWAPAKKAKKKMPHRVVLEGNHEHRIERALDLSPEYAGTIGFADYQFGDYYDDVVRYNGGTPGIYERDGILFAHFFVAGVSGRPISGEWPARMLMAKNNQSSIQSHVHVFDYAVRRTAGGKTINCLVAGCYQDYVNDWAGNMARLWRPGVAVLRNVVDGDYDLQWVSLEALKAEYQS